MATNSKSHPGNEVLECYSLGNLSESDLERVEEHLFVCAQCQDELAGIDSYISDIKGACREMERRTAPRRAGLFERLGALLTLPLPAYAGAFAALALAVGLPLMRMQPVTGPVAEVQLSTSRGADTVSVEAAARRPLHLQLDASRLAPSASFRSEIVNREGSTVWQGSATRQGASLSFDVRKSLGTGVYWVRLYDSESTLVHEYRLDLK
jgi:anti-sigma factor RsiW